VFVSYARKDEGLRDKLFDHLGGLRAGGYISAWSDGQIVPGQEWAPEIIRRLADIQAAIDAVRSHLLRGDLSEAWYSTPSASGYSKSAKR
jgi:hypothetical protein